MINDAAVDPTFGCGLVTICATESTIVRTVFWWDRIDS